ncbi:MAG: Fe-S cluster assembly protein SufB [Candidatus Aenigmarchaeota archaeon]|nr:Fe-S cluster assembly protein SufB [Candidatus Aenigmarchaeota archaeon]
MAGQKTGFLDINTEKYREKNDVKEFRLPNGLSEAVVRKISEIKKEPEWMLNIRLKALAHFLKRTMPAWGADLSVVSFDDIAYYVSPNAKTSTDWKDVPKNIKKTFDKLGIPEAEKKFLSGAGTQFDSETVYHKVREDLAKLGVIFCDTDTAIKEHPELVKKYFGTVVPFADNKFAALNTAVWSGGSFVYIPKGVKVELPLQAYFRINAKNVGQFERTLIIVEEGASVHYIEGCFTAGAPVVTSNGIKKIEDVKVGDFVITHNNRLKKVYHIQVRPHTGGLFTIQYFGDSTKNIEVTGEHPFLAVKRQKHEYKNTEWKPDWVKVEDLGKEDYLAIPIDRKVETQEERIFPIEKGTGRHGFKTIEFKIKTDSDFFRLAGYYLSEGSIVGGHYVHFTFNENERLYIDDVKELLKKYFGEQPWEQKPYKHGISLVLSSTAAARFFETQFSKGAAGKRIPDWVMKESPEKQKELVKGFWRGDGSFMMHQYAYGVKRMFRMNTISKNIAESLHKMLLRMNIFASLNKHKRTGKRKDIYCVHVGGSFLKAFANAVGTYPSTEIAVGKQIAFQMLQQINAKSFAHITENYAFVPIKSISSREVENVPVYNFGVEEDESYIANGVAVHNCSAPTYSTNSLHSAVVEVIAHKNSRVRYTTLQNWANNVFNLVTKRAYAYENSYVEWLDANIGSRITMKYPSVYLMGPGAKTDILSIAFANSGQHQDTGAKAVHLASNTSSTIVSKSVSKGNGITTYRGLVKVIPGAKNCKSHVKCDALILNKEAKSDTIPYMEIEEKDTTIGHEAVVGKVSEEQLFYLMSRGLSEQQALTMIVSGFLQPFTKQLPLEYAVEFNRLIELEMTGAVG